MINTLPQLNVYCKRLDNKITKQPKNSEVQPIHNTFRGTDLAGRLSENSRSSFVYLQSQKDKRNRPKNKFFKFKAEMLDFD